MLLKFSSSLFDVNVIVVPDEFQSQIEDLECNENFKLNFVVLHSCNYTSINSLHLVIILQC